VAYQQEFRINPRVTYHFPEQRHQNGCLSRTSGAYDHIDGTTLEE
jgi:hypothetical protein